MRQDTVIAAFVFLAFIVFITLKGELPVYMGFFVPGSSGTATGPALKTPGTPGVTADPLKGLPSNWGDFIFGGLPGGIGDTVRKWFGM